MCKILAEIFSYKQGYEKILPKSLDYFEKFFDLTILNETLKF